MKSVLASAFVALFVLAAPALAQEREDLQVFNDIAGQVNRYTQLTIFDSISAEVTDGKVRLTGWVTGLKLHDHNCGLKVFRGDAARSLVLEYDPNLAWHNWKAISDEGYIRNHNNKGDTLYGIEIMVDPEFRGMKLSRRLYDARKELCRERNLCRMMIGGRIPGYGAHAAARRC